MSSYLDYSNRDDLLSGGARMIPIETPQGPFRVWTKRIGNNPRIKVLLLHGGPAAPHDYLEAFDSYFPSAGIEYYYYDQLGAGNSDQPDEPSLWELPRCVEEVEQVRTALKLGKENFYLFGHSWGGMLAIEYALKYQQNLKGMIISNMMADGLAYNEYAHKVLMPAMDQTALQEILRLEAAKEYDSPRYMELLIPNFYEHHILRMPAAEWPDPLNRAFARLNHKIYVQVNGPSEMGWNGSMKQWDRLADLGGITVPTLTVGAKHDTMDPAHMEAMSRQLPRGHYLYCPKGSHLAMYDDQKTYFDGLISFIRDVDGGKI